MIFFRSDYSQGAHPKVMDALMKTYLEHSDGYGMDAHCEHAAQMIKDLIGIQDCDVHMMVGGTPCNVTVIAASLKPYESVIAARTGHAYFHETGAVEATGHRVVAMEGINGKLTPEIIDQALTEYQDEHTPKPRMVYISQPTEIGSIYSKEEMAAISTKCKEHDLLLYVDGARLGSALTCKANNMSIRELASYCDAFYIGGTKNGALFGEALVIKNKQMNENFRFMIKRQCGLLAKGRLLGVQFEALLDGGMDSIYFSMAAHANRMADKLKEGLAAMNVRFCGDSQTNQIFPIFRTDVVRELEKDFFFYEWEPEKDGKTAIRLVTSWGTDESDVDAFLNRVREIIK